MMRGPAESAALKSGTARQPGGSRFVSVNLARVCVLTISGLDLSHVKIGADWGAALSLRLAAVARGSG
jgi:hypothetical protein